MCQGAGINSAPDFAFLLIPESLQPPANCTASYSERKPIQPLKTQPQLWLHLNVSSFITFPGFNTLLLFNLLKVLPQAIFFCPVLCNFCLAGLSNMSLKLCIPIELHTDRNHFSSLSLTFAALSHHHHLGKDLAFKAPSLSKRSFCFLSGIHGDKIGAYSCGAS